jgi:hypothetical protein
MTDRLSRQQGRPARDRLRRRQPQVRSVGRARARPVRSADGQAIGEIAVSGNEVMLRFYRDDQATGR